MLRACSGCRGAFVLLPFLVAGGPARADLVSHWALDGDTQDSAGANHGTFAGGSPLFVPGHDGGIRGAIQLDGAGDLVAMPQGGGLPIYSSGGYSVAFWVRGLPQRSRVVFAEGFSSAAGTPPQVFSIGPDSRGATGRLEVVLRDDRGVFLLDRVLSDATAFDGEWHCIVWVDADRRGALYVDGVRDPADFDYSLAGVEEPTFNFTAVGGMPLAAPCCFLAGAVDEVRVYDHALSEADVRALCPPGPSVCPPASIASVEPRLVSTAGGTSIEVLASGLQEGATASVGGLPLLDQTLLRSGTEIVGIQGLTPALAPGFHDVTVHCASGEIAGRSIQAVEAAAPPEVTGVTPSQASSDGTTLIEIRGAGFREETLFTVGVHAMEPESVDATSAIGFAPALVAGEPLGPRDVAAEDSRGRDVLPGAITYVLVDDPCAARRHISSVAPSLVSSLGGTVIEVRGSGFRNGDTARVGGQPLEGQEVIDPGAGGAPLIRGTVPALEEGFHGLDVLCATGEVVATLPRAVEAAPPPELVRVVPHEVSTEGGTLVVVEGANLRAMTLVRFGGRPLREPVAATDGTSITGYAPPLGEGAGGGVRPGATVVDVTAEDSRGRAALRGGVTYVPPPVLIPGPEEVEASLAEGTARFTWFNPIAYDEIEVVDEDDNVLMVLDGDETFLEIPSGGQSNVGVRLKGKVLTHASAAVGALAMLHECDRPPPLMWGGEPCNAFVPDDPDAEIPFCAQTLSLDGGHQPANITRCPAAPDGEGGAYLPDPAALPYVPRDAGGGGAIALRLGHGGHRGGGGALAGPKKGYVVQHEFADNLAIQLAGNRLVTGFILDEPADRLEIAAYYEKLATAFGLELRGQLIHVFPPDGFRDEFTFPDVPIHAGRKLNCITYFRADKDIGHAGNPDDPDPANHPPKSCKLQIPAGEYRLELYAVGGNPKVQYYTFNTDQHDNEILIQGVPCPPYPLVKITDMTGLRTLPDITSIDAELPDYAPIQQVMNPCSGIRVRFKAHGLWLDEQNNEHPVPPVAPSDDNPHFEYKWTVHDRPNPMAKVTGKSPILNYCVTDWGCYKVDIEVRDLQCGFVKTRTYEVPIVPDPEDLPCPVAPFTFLFPTPDPGGMYGVVGLKPPSSPLGPGFFDGTRPVSFRVLVTPQCYCAETTPCAAPCLETDPSCPANLQVEFRLAWKSGNTYTRVEGVEIKIVDLCPNVTEGAKYYAVEIEDLGTIPPQKDLGGNDLWIQKTPYNVYFQGRQKQTNPNTGWRNVGETESPGKALKLFARPSSLDTTFWNGHFVEADQSYHFVSKTASGDEQSAPIGPSNELDLGLPAVDVSVPSYNNNVATGFTSRFMMLNGVWGPEVGAGSTSGEVVSNSMDGQPFEVEPNVSGDGGGGASFPVYEWCRGDEILNESISQTLFESIIYTGTIWVIPVTIWARIGLGLDLFIASHALIRVSPFGPLEGGPFAQAEFSLDSSVKLSIPCEISCDILGGVLSIALRLIPSATFLLKANVGTIDASPHINYFAECFLDLLMQIEGCIDLLITEACLTYDVPILEHETLISSGQCFNIPTCDDDDVPITPCGGGGGVIVKEQKVGGGAGVIQFQLPYQSISAPVTIFSPDRSSFMEMSFDEQGLTSIQVNGAPAESPSFGLTTGDLLNPAATFVSNSAILIAWTDGYCGESGLLEYCFPDPENPPPPASLAQLNLMQAQQEMVLSTVVFKVEPPFVDPRWILGEKFRIADPPGEVPDPANRRVDGMAAVAADLSVMSDDPPGGEAIVAWVRYEGDFLVLDGTKTIYVPLPDGQTQICPRQGGGFKTCRFETQTVDNIRPQMELTSIYARRVSLSGPIQGEDKVKLSPPGINIEPAVALSPSGDIGYCVWVHDPSPMTGHVDLTGSNLGRQLLYSVYSRQTNSWSAPVSVLPVIADYDDKFPGVLEPHIALKDNLNGLLAFTSVKPGGPANDSGLGGSRFVYGCRLVNGVFGTPFLIHGKCLRRVYGWKPQVVIDIPDLFDPMSLLNIPLPEEIIFWQETGPAGLDEGAGDVMVSPILPGLDVGAPAQGLFNDNDIHSNVSGALANGVFSSLSLNSGPAELGAETGAGGGVPRSRRFQTFVKRLEADLAITGCRLSHAFPAPGSRISADVEVENLGLAGSPYDDLGQSAVGLEAVFVELSGEERVVADAPVPILLAGQVTTVRLHLEMPHDPVRLRVRLSPNPIDADGTNDLRECLFGSPAPTGVVCEAIQIEGDPPRPAMKLTWRNAGLYDELWIYRDGSMIASLPPSSTMFIDLYAPPGTQEYCVRGRMGASKSVKTAAVCEAGGPFFRRGFVNDDARDDISDDIALLGYLFLGNPAEISCEKAADNDDNGRVEITDAVRHLNYKFSGGPPPPPPYDTCGPDPTPDGLGCERPPGCP